MALSYANGLIAWLASDAVSATKTVSGLSFQPKALKFTATTFWSTSDVTTDLLTEAFHFATSVGFATSTSNRETVASIEHDNQASMTCGSVYHNAAVVVQVTSTAITGLLDLDLIASDGFRLIVDDQGVDNVAVFWEAWGGSDITNVTVGAIAEPAANGNQDYTATGFTSGGTDQVVMLAGVQSVSAAGTREAQDSGMYMGFATTGGTDAENIVCAWNQDVGSASGDTDGYARAGHCLAQIVIAGGNPDAVGKCTQAGTDNFRINWTRALTNRRSVYMAIKGGGWKVGSYTINGNTGSATATVSGLAFAPVGISLIGAMKTEAAASTSSVQARMSFGFGTSTTSRRCFGHLSEDATANDEVNGTIQHDQVLAFPSTTGTLQSAYDINAMNSDGFQIIVDTAGGVASEWQGYLAFGDAPAAGANAVPVRHFMLTGVGI